LLYSPEGFYLAFIRLRDTAGVEHRIGGVGSERGSRPWSKNRTWGHRETWNSTRSSGEHKHQVNRHRAWCFLLKITERQCEEIRDSKAAKITLVERGLSVGSPWWIEGKHLTSFSTLKVILFRILESVLFYFSAHGTGTSVRAGM
jgi:hypothetical protein